MRELIETEFHGWPALVLRQGPLCLQLVPSVGGRLMGMAHGGRELCFIHPDLLGQHFDGSNWDRLRGDWDFPLWGGGKTWIGPQEDWPGGAPHRDLDSGAWRVLRSWCDEDSMGATLQSPVCGQSGLQITRCLSLSRDGAWSVEHGLANRGAQTQRCGLWDVLMLNSPAEVWVELPAVDDPAIALPGHPSLAQLRAGGILDLADHGARVSCAPGLEFKCGFASEAGRLVVDFAALGLRYERLSPVPAGSVHAHGRPLEVFNAPRLPYFEVETHSPLATLAPGEAINYAIAERIWAPGAQALQPPESVS